ncbi:LacI family DNA-binding transcriptional regulator [Chachezhania antarctica]|uniref:LacI family DNA-binding transcriptional regulator n=1 Tax=Chachezhania antarctica TaxID=2340860 RepID=UPI0013CEAA45|nr:LacI family DNA-binding transcriptional regulator [Chachezhania antarctica]|tara:strand:+ start:11164 stop:12201 length:1038 start_codon:yes stop_codon:yes gene_type:complete
MRSPTLNDVARLAGVSYATADRVVNHRGNVADKSVRKVLTAVEQLGYVRNVAAANLSRSRTYRLAFLMPGGSNPFFERMHAHLEKAASHLKHSQVSINIVIVDAFAVEALEQAIEVVAGADYDGIAIVGLGNDRLVAPLNALRDRGTRIVSLVSDLPDSCREHYVGINNLKAGRSAARLMGMAHAGGPGRALVAVGSLDAPDHADRLQGFRTVLEEDFPEIEIASVIEMRDQSALMHRMMMEAWSTTEGVSAVYNVGAGNEGLIDALRIMDRPRRFCSIVHDLIPPTRRALEDGTLDAAIDQRPEIEINRALTLLRAIVDDLPPPPMPELIPAIFVRDNLPDETV